MAKGLAGLRALLFNTKALSQVKLEQVPLGLGCHPLRVVARLEPSTALINVYTENDGTPFLSVIDLNQIDWTRLTLDNVIT